jgi:hypothetical protein
VIKNSLAERFVEDDGDAGGEVEAAGFFVKHGDSQSMLRVTS